MSANVSDASVQKAKEQVEFLCRNVTEVLSKPELIAKIGRSVELGKPLKVKAGFDPSSPDIHFGHTVLLSKLREFQDLGHEVIFIIGDATARVGDPSGRTQTRPVLSDADIQKNARTYQEQAFKVLDPAKTRTVYNNEWFGGMKFHDMMGLASRITVSQILQRDDFSKRMASNAPISLLELFYPLMQAFDSVQLKSDIELGGTDQKFNLLLGRELQKEFGQEPQVVITMPLLVGLDGTQKMSKSLGNHIGVSEDPKSMFGKCMSISDELMVQYYNLLTATRGADIQKRVQSGELHPKIAKEELAEQLTARFCGAAPAAAARSEFNQVFSNRQNPTDMPHAQLPAGRHPIVKVVTAAGLAASGGAARRLVEQGAVSWDGVAVRDPQDQVEVTSKPAVLKVGKKGFASVSSGASAKP
jgi:tyrosyl-tRNA synthetase